MNYQTECLLKFNSLPEFIRDSIGGDESSEFIDDLERKYNISLDFAVVLISIGELSIDDLPAYLNMKHQIKLSDGVAVKNELAKNIFYIFSDVEVNDNTENEVITNEMIIKMFQSELRNIFRAEANIIHNLNNSLLVNFSTDNGLSQEDLEKLLYINGELLTHSEFMLDGKQYSPTIGNWIQDFIQYYGSGMFSNLVLTKYLTDSDNARRLPPEEKKLVHKLLQLYRNIKFFPESLQDVPAEDWEIIPLDKDSRLAVQPRKIIGPPKTEEEKKIEELKQEEKEFSAGGLEQLAIEEEIGKKKKLEDLKIEAKKYAIGSLERMAVEEEVRKLEARS